MRRLQSFSSWCDDDDDDEDDDDNDDEDEDDDENDDEDDVDDHVRIKGGITLSPLDAYVWRAGISRIFVVICFYSRFGHPVLLSVEERTKRHQERTKTAADN